MTNKISNAFTIIRDKFHHIAMLGGPQYAAVLRIRDLEIRLYVSGVKPVVHPVKRPAYGNEIEGAGV